MESYNTVGLLYLQGPHPWIQPTVDQKYLGKRKFQKVPKGKTLISPTPATVYIIFTLY